MNNTIASPYKPELDAPMQCPLCDQLHRFKWNLYGVALRTSTGIPIRGWSVCVGRPVLLAWKWELALTIPNEDVMLKDAIWEINFQEIDRVVRRDIEDMITR